ncbi:MAG: cation:dicarboxylase symporter family transporter [Steroidobacteraceae bacterium]
MVTGSVGGLVLGIVAGVASHGSDNSLLHSASPYIAGIGALWINALGAVVIPLTVVNVIAAVLRTGDARQSGVMSAKAFALFCIWMTLGAILTLMIVPFVINQLTIDPAIVTGMVKSVSADALVAAQARPAPSSPSDVAAMLMPRNLLKAALNEELLPLLIASIAFAFAVLRTGHESRETITRVVRGLSDALLVVVGWVISLMPLGAFAMAFTFAENVGWGVAGILGQFTMLVSAAMIGLTLLMYPLTWLFAKVPMRQFAAAAVPAQLAALSTRSSLASLPGLLQSASRLGIRSEVANLALPLSVAVFKVNRTSSTLIKLLFLCWMFNIDLTVWQVASFTVTSMIMSFAVLGIPNGGGGWKSMAVYLSLGIPIEGYVLLGAVEPIVDIFKTVLNVTGDLSVTAVLDRRTPAPEVVAASEESLSAAA